MEWIKEKSLKKKRQEQQFPQSLEQSLTELELQNIEKDRAMTDLEIAILELQNQ